MKKARSAVEQLRWHYFHPFAQAIQKSAEGMPVAGMTSNTVPWELMRAAGYFPVILNPSDAHTPIADRFMEDGVFSTRIRGIFEGITSGAWPFLKMVVIPRTSEQEHKLFLYLREVGRQGFSKGLPHLYLYNLLHTRSAEAEQYGLERTREFSTYFRANDLTTAIEESNRARRSIRKLLAFREGAEPRLSGTEALALIGAVYFMDRAEYARLADEAALDFSRHTPLPGPRILIKGSPLHHTGLHRAIESHGAVVVAEDDWWGSRALTQEIVERDDPVCAIFRMYYREAPSPREASNDWFLARSATVEGVVFYLPQEDDVFGWDYPGLREALDQRGIPSLLLREDAANELSSECHRCIAEFVQNLDT